MKGDGRKCERGRFSWDLKVESLDGTGFERSVFSLLLGNLVPGLIPNGKNFVIVIFF